MNTSLLIIVFIAVMLALALLPWVHRTWTNSQRSRPTRSIRTELEEHGAFQQSDDREEVRETRETSAQEESVSPGSMRERLSKARGMISSRLSGIRGGPVDSSMWEELEEILILADVGVDTTLDLVNRLRDRAEAEKLEKGTDLLEALKAQMKSDLRRDRKLSLTASQGTVPVWLFVGVNGAGKTTSIGKVARRLTDDGLSVLLAAGDTFRAAAAEQLEKWARSCGADFVRGNEGADPSSVIYDSAEAALAREIDIVLADTAGRLHNKVNLMEELAKVRRVADRESGEVSEVLLVIDATTGQNGLKQAKEFTEAVGVTGVVLTKLDGSAKGGIVFAVERELDLPVKLVGLGEGDLDLVDFDPGSFVDALFGDD
ncbi:MAG: signal recognition particle-docking protein FtsY [Actinomycetota bacterium]|nr:signal recognition particle-docking protein FtsY [Actinomycetota bacterium]MED5293363.1 signal recognition particle-docking protein FtsY [Actinomycetota bacterium]